MKYATLQDGEWTTPVMRGYRMVCCDCGLVHRVDFRVRKSGSRPVLQFRASRDQRATARQRRKAKQGG